MIISLIAKIFILFFTLMLLIGFHEWGHFWVARRFGVKIKRFAIGFGKPLWIKQGATGTEYALCIFPLGGYVKFEDQSAFDSMPVFKRMLVIAAGPFCNLIAAFLAYWIVFVAGITQPVPYVAQVLPGSPAAASGILSNSEIVAIDHQTTATWPAVIFRLLPHLGREDKFSIATLQQGQLSTHVIAISKWQLNPLRPNLLSSLGILPPAPPLASPQRTRQFSYLKAMPAAFQEVEFYLQANAIILAKLLTGAISLQALVSPLGLFAGTLTALHQGVIAYIAFLGFLSVGLAFANILPIPGLDGAQLCYLLIEKITGKPLSLRLQWLLFRLGMIILSVLMFQALVNDMLRGVS